DRPTVGIRQIVYVLFLSIGYGYSVIRMSVHRCLLSPARRRCLNRASRRPLSNRWFWAYLPLIIMIFANLRFYGNLLGRSSFYATDDLCGDAESTCNADNVGCYGLRYIELHAVPHVEYFIHLLPVRTRFFLDEPEEGGDVEQVIFNYMEVIDEVQDLGLGTSAAMHHPVYLRAVIVEYLLNDGGVCAGGGEHQLTHGSRAVAGDVDGVRKPLAAGEYQFVGYRGVVAFGKPLCDGFVEYIVPCGG